MIRIVSNGIACLADVRDAAHLAGASVVHAHELATDERRGGLLVVPNGSDHVALWRARDAIRAHLDAGGTLFCEDGWFTSWVPGNRWQHDNTHATADVRYRVRNDRHGFFDGIDLAAFDFQNDISGWWACGFIEPARGADVVMVDTWDRPVVVVDEVTTAGRLVLTASGPLTTSWLAPPLHAVFARIRELADV